jgi:hypothetical protein
MKKFNFDAINATALTMLPALAARWLPDGRRLGNEWCALNPKRPDRHVGSFKINLKTGRWADFATDVRGRDVIGLAAYLGDMTRVQAARALLKTLGLS